MVNYSIDTRTIEPGDIFIPVKGPRFDGRDFIDDAIKKGARILDVDLAKFATNYRKKLKCHVIGVTGSAGKTTVKDLLTAILSQKYNVVSTSQNQNNEIGVPLTVLKADHQTDILIVEMAMRNLGDMAYLTKMVRPTHAVITNIGLSHIELLKTQRNVAKAKGEIFRKALAWENGKRYAFLNHTTPYYNYLLSKAQKTGFDPLPFGGETLPEQNINLCEIVARHFGLENDDIVAGINAYKSSSHRLKVVPNSMCTVIDDTYNANPDGARYAMQYCQKYPGRKIMVLGAMKELGSESESAHQQVVEDAVEHGISILFTIGEETKAMKSDLISIYHFDSKDDLHAQLLPEIKQGDVVLVKGSRSMQMEETVKNIQDNYG